MCGILGHVYKDPMQSHHGGFIDRFVLLETRSSKVAAI